MSEDRPTLKQLRELKKAIKSGKLKLEPVKSDGARKIHSSNPLL